jgi:hypothetical protein
MRFEDLQELNEGAVIEIEYKGETMKYQIKDISKEWWEWLGKVSNINVIESNDKLTEK